MAVVDEKDFLLITREMLLLILDIQAHVGTLHLAIQKHGGITLEQIQECRAELERRKPLDQLREKTQALGFEDLLKILRDYEGPIQ